MRRSREIAAAPERSTNDAVLTITQLVRDTLAASQLDLAEIDLALDSARPGLLALVAGGHLDCHPVVLVAASLHLSITTVTGDRALALEENLATVPGAASATTWTLYLPTPDPLAETVAEVARRHARLSIEEPPDDAKSEARAASMIDLDAFSRRGE